MTLYHGSNMIMQAPKILTNGHYKDFGYGFYCTNLEKQAIRWAHAKRNHHIVNVYTQHLQVLEHPQVLEQEPKNAEPMRVLVFPEMTEEWLDFVAACRQGIEHDWDIVEGPMADDTIWDYIESFQHGEISREAFWALAKFKYPTHQIVFCTERALRTLTFERGYTV